MRHIVVKERHGENGWIFRCGDCGFQATLGVMDDVPDITQYGDIYAFDVHIQQVTKLAYDKEDIHYE